MSSIPRGPLSGIAMKGFKCGTTRPKKRIRPRLRLEATTRQSERWSLVFVRKPLANEFDRPTAHRPLPESIVYDNGRPEFASKAIRLWSQQSGVERQFTPPRTPTQNACVDSCDGKFRAPYLDRHRFSSMADVREPIERRRTHYNAVRAHRSLGFELPTVFAQCAP